MGVVGLKPLKQTNGYQNKKAGHSKDRTKVRMLDF